MVSASSTVTSNDDRSYTLGECAIEIVDKRVLRGTTWRANGPLTPSLINATGPDAEFQCVDEGKFTVSATRYVNVDYVIICGSQFPCDYWANEQCGYQAWPEATSPEYDCTEPEDDPPDDYVDSVSSKDTTFTQVDASQQTAASPSSVRAVVSGDTITWYVPAAELPAATPGYRVTAFGHDGAYSADDRGGDVSGADPTEPLTPLPTAP